MRLSAAAQGPGRTWLPAAGGVWLKRAAAVAAAVELFLLGYEARPNAAPVVGSLRAGALSVSLDHGWTPSPAGASLVRGQLEDGASLLNADGSRAEFGRLAGAAGAAAPFAGLFGGRSPAPRPVVIGGRAALAYRTGGSGAAAYVFTLRDGGRLAVVCRSATRTDACAPLAATARVEGAVDPGPRPAVATALSTAMGALSAQVVGNQGRLRARANDARAEGTRRMADAYASFARMVGTLAASERNPVHGGMLAAIRAAAQAVSLDFARLAAAAASRERGLFAFRRAQLVRHEAALRTAVGGLRDRGYLVRGNR